MKVFSMTGNFKLGSQWRNFEKEVEAETEEHAKELLFKIFGGKHSLPRRFINIIKIYHKTDRLLLSSQELLTIAKTTGESVILEDEKGDSKKIPSAADD